MKKDYFLGLSEEGFHRVAYTEWGTMNHVTSPIICAHGLTRNGRDFDSLADYLAQRDHHVYCPDIVGRGDSDWLKNPLHYTYEQYLADMNAMIAHTQAKQIDWIGTSMGGLIGMLLASLPHSPIQRLIMNDVGPQIPVKAIARLSKYAGKDPDFSSIEEAKMYFKSIYGDFGNLNDAQWQRLTENSIRETAPGKFSTKIDPAIKQSSAKSKLAWKLLFNPHKALEGTFFDIDLWQIWRQVTCPVLVIHGTRSDLLLPSIIEKMRSLHPNIEVFEVSDAGHAPALQDPMHQEMIYQWLMKNKKAAST
ncbi:MAG: alpha/beta hydrolase [Gammaproteobacteria bacterium]|nr:alpha/beta hydrolase [Gammaproteobacteria bacterium]MCW5583016.1 alpha/beta hydrolase [Gammaproteobacteria bacterium]